MRTIVIAIILMLCGCMSESDRRDIAALQAKRDALIAENAASRQKLEDMKEETARIKEETERLKAALKEKGK